MNDRNYATYQKLLGQGLSEEEALAEMRAWLHPSKAAALEELIRAKPKAELKGKSLGSKITTEA